MKRSRSCALVAAAVLLAACGGDDESSPTSTDPAPTTDSTLTTTTDLADGALTPSDSADVTADTTTEDADTIVAEDVGPSTTTVIVTFPPSTANDGDGDGGDAGDAGGGDGGGSDTGSGSSTSSGGSSTTGGSTGGSTGATTGGTTGTTSGTSSTSGGTSSTTGGTSSTTGGTSSTTGGTSSTTGGTSSTTGGTTGGGTPPADLAAGQALVIIDGDEYAFGVDDCQVEDGFLVANGIGTLPDGREFIAGAFYDFFPGEEPGEDELFFEILLDIEPPSPGEFDAVPQFLALKIVEPGFIEGDDITVALNGSRLEGSGLIMDENGVAAPADVGLPMTFAIQC